MRYVIALDIGIRNMGICVYDNVCSKIVYWDDYTSLLVPRTSTRASEDAYTYHERVLS